MAVHPPTAAQRPTEIEQHGEVRTDPYAWLRVENWQEVMRNPQALDSEVRAHLEAENQHTEAFFADPDLRTHLFEEMKARIKEDDSSVPMRDGPWAYQSRFEMGGQHPIFVRHPTDDPSDVRVLLHGDRMAEGHKYWNLGTVEHSPDHSLLGYSVDQKGSEYYDLCFIDLEGSRSFETVEDTSGDFVWANDSRTVLYTRLDANHRPSKVYRHELGTDPSQDVLLYEEPDPGFFVGVDKTESRAFLVIDAHDHVTSEVRLIPADDPTQEPLRVRAREPGVEYDVHHDPAPGGSGRLLIRTNRDGAEDFKVVVSEVGEDRPWVDWVPHRPGHLISSMSVFARHVVRLEWVNALPRLVVTPASDEAEHVIEFEEEAYSLGLHGSFEFDTSTLRFSYSSMTTPSRVFDYDMVARSRILRKEQEVPSGHDPGRYVTRRLEAVAADGEKIPVSILHRKDLDPNEAHPVLLYGYGSYGLKMPASFSTTRFSLVDRGFIYAIAHIRGGMEKGYRWYTEGKASKKRNTFGDFAAAARHLVQTGLTRPGLMAAHGGSAGGMLMGVMANEHPDLFGAIVAEVPFVDVLNTMSDPELPLTPPEWPEWGNPVEDPKAYRVIKDYSPYDNVAAHSYPAILATAGLTDPRVTYWEPAKWVARLRERATSDRPLLLYTNMDAGHGGASGRFERLKETALMYAFLLKVFGRESESGEE